MSVQIDTRGFINAFTDLLAGLRNGAHQALVAAVKAAHTSARTTDLFKDGPDARLRSTIEMRIDDAFHGAIRAGGRGAPYARFVNDGTAPHEIRATSGRLRFEVAGAVFYRRMVHHPGTQPRPFMDRAGIVGQQTLDYGLEIMAERPIATFNAG